MIDNSSPKRIPKSLGTDAKLFGTYTLSDLAVAVFPGVLVVLLLQMVLPETVAIAGTPLRSLTLPLAIGAIALGALFVFLTPTYVSSVDWLSMMVGFQRRPTRLPHEAAKEQTHVERVFPERNAFERTDGTLVGIIQVDSPAMALATSAEWTRTANAFQNLLNTAVDFPIQIYSTTQRFPTETYLAHYEARLEDPDVEANPRLERLIHEYIDWYAADLAQREMTIRDHYVIVPVTPQESQFGHDSLLSKLTTLPVLGVFLQVWFAAPLAEQREAMFDTLDSRIRRLESGIREIEGCNARRIDATEATRLVAEFWAGESREYVERDRVVRTRPFVADSGGDS